MDKLLTKNFCGFEFVEIGKSTFFDKPSRRKTKLPWHLGLKLNHPDFALAGKSVYIVTHNDDVLYVGMYSGNFKERWLAGGNYIWHSDNVADNINDLLKAGSSCTIWLSINPFTTIQGLDINISTDIESYLIEQYKPQWNTVGVNKSDKDHLLVNDIVSSYSI
jgi:hypothetical protein